MNALLEGGSFCGEVADDTALAALLRAIRDVIGRPPTLKTSDAELVATVRGALCRHHEAERLCVEADDDDTLLLEECAKRWDELMVIQGQIPNPPFSPLHVLLHPEIAYHGADKTDDEQLQYLNDGDCFERPSARLIEACTAWFGGRPQSE